jgi:hypothetical protein
MLAQLIARMGVPVRAVIREKGRPTPTLAFRTRRSSTTNSSTPCCRTRF